MSPDKILGLKDSTLPYLNVICLLGVPTNVFKTCLDLSLFCKIINKTKQNFMKLLPSWNIEFGVTNSALLRPGSLKIAPDKLLFPLKRELCLCHTAITKQIPKSIRIQTSQDI